MRILGASLLMPLLLCACSVPSGPIGLNELLPSNRTGITDATGGFPDWIELHNRGDEDLSLDGYSITDDGSLPERHVLSADLVVAAGGYRLLFPDGDPNIGPDHLAFRLSGGGEDVLLYALESDGPRLVDSVTFGAVDSDVSIARQPDATGPWRADTTPTPGEPND